MKNFNCPKCGSTDVVYQKPHVLCAYCFNQRPIFDLNVTDDLFQMIKSGIKTEIYREITQYYQEKFDDNKILIGGLRHNAESVFLRVSNGYSKNRPQLIFLTDELSVGTGKIQWGAPDKECYILKLGELIPSFKGGFKHGRD